MHPPKWSQELWKGLVDLFAPRGCALCGASSAELVCPHCTRVPLTPCKHEVRPLENVPVITPFQFASPMSDAIHRLKYGDRPDLAWRMAQLSAPSVQRWLEGAPEPRNLLVVPVPLHAARLAHRGYNQAALLAQPLSAALRLRCDVGALARRRATEPQALQTAEARRTNLQGAFVTRRALHGVRVVLVDDVFTTGSTAIACMTAIRDAGGSVAAIVAVARAGALED